MNIANGLAEHGYNSYLCATRAEGELKTQLYNNVGYCYLRKKNNLDFRALAKLKNFILKNNIQLIHAHSTSFFTAFLIKTLFLPKIKIVWHDHYGNSDLLEDRKYKILQFCANKFNATIAVNTKLKNWHSHVIKSAKTYYLPNFAILKNVTNYTHLKGNNKKRICCLANLRPQKDHLNLLKAFKLVLKKHSDWTLHLVGNDNEDSYSLKLKTFICNENLTNNVFIYGSRNDIKNILEQSDLGVLSSKSEGLPISLLEYGLAKLPVVVTNVGECNTVISHKNNGLIVPSENEIELANAIIVVIEDKRFRDILGINLYKTITEGYSKESYLNNLDKIYNV